MPDLNNTALRIFPAFDNFFHTINDFLSNTQAWLCLATFWIVSGFTWLTIRGGYFLRKYLYITPASDRWPRLIKCRFVLLTIQGFLLTASQSYGQLIHSSIILGAEFFVLVVQLWDKFITTELCATYVRFTLNQCALISAIGYGPNGLMVCAVVLYQLLDLACARGGNSYSIHSFRISPAHPQIGSVYALLNQHPIAYFVLVAGILSVLLFVGSSSLWVNSELSVFVCSSTAVFIAVLFGPDPMRQNVVVAQQGHQNMVLRTVTFTELIYACLLISLHLLIGGVMYNNTTLIVVACLLIVLNVVIWILSPFMYAYSSFGCDFGVKWKRNAEDIEYDFTEDENSVAISDFILEREWNNFVKTPSSTTAERVVEKILKIRGSNIPQFVWMAQHDHRDGFECPFSHITMNGTSLTYFSDSSDT